MSETLTPMLKQYLAIKDKHKDAILFFRLGDFYEMFFDDAKEASKILDIVLTSRQNGVPLCGIPYHAAESYMARLIKAGKRVAICEQLETVPSSGNIVKREVTRIVTPGTVIEPNLLESDDNNFLAAAVLTADKMGLAFADISTGDFFIASMDKSLDMFRSEMNRFSPAEIVINETEGDEEFFEYLKLNGIAVYKINRWFYDREYMERVITEAFSTANLKGLGLTEEIDIITSGAIVQYLKETQKRSFEHLKAPRRLLSSDKMILDEATAASMELVRNGQDGSKQRTLFSVLDKTETPMGRRLLEQNILQPLTDISEIENRLDFVTLMKDDTTLASDVVKELKRISDLERIVSRFTLGKIITRNFLGLADSLFAACNIKQIFAGRQEDFLRAAGERLPDTRELAVAIKNTIADEPAVTPEQGRVVRIGFDEELDNLYALKSNAKEWILRYEEEEKARTGITILRVRYNKILGYYIEISKGQAGNAPADYYRKQTLVGAERFTTDKLQAFEGDILSSTEKILARENKIINELCEKIRDNRAVIQKTAEEIAAVDFYLSLAAAAKENRFARPSLNTEGVTDIQDARHPIVEKFYTKEVFIPNDVLLDPKENIVQIITGPNMAGKSTYIRMCGLIQLMAQIGSYVPAAKANISIVDRIFTRIGASDNISRGESTFLVEMNETANIVNNATEKSLIIMDEIGRGTSTYDGLSIAWAVVEYILRYIKAKTLFATHYHELTALGKKQGIVNYNVLVRESINGVDFLHKVTQGTADKSYGIHVAKLAGLPSAIISRAGTILDKLEKSAAKKQTSDTNADEQSSEQLEIFNASNHLILQAIQNMDCDALTPIEALNELHRLKKLL